VTDQPPSYEVLAALVVSLRAELVETRAGLERAQARIAELEAQLAANSRNSSKPPSSEGLGKPPPKPRSLRKKSGRKPGGQNGHEGRTLRQVAKPKHEKVHEPGCCAGCGSSLAGRPITAVERRQCFDLPPITVEVTEHQLVERECTCGRRTRAGAPAGVDAPVQYGPRITAIVLYLYLGQFLSKARTADALTELFGTPISTGTVAAMARRAAGKLDGFLDLVRGRIVTADAAHFDETGLRVAGRLHWVHSASTGKYTLLTVHRKRGVAAMDAAGVLPGFTGIAHHDAWAPYDTYAAATHALCNAHALRELAAVAEQTPEGHWCWASQVADALIELKTLVETALAGETGLDGIDRPCADAAIHRYRSAATLGAGATAARSTPLTAKHHALTRRLLERQNDYLRFISDPRASFDNNAAEREIRMVKLRQKVSGCLRTLTGAEQFCAIRSYLATAAKHGICFFQSLVQLAEGRPWMPETA
jgi:transposase